MEVAALGWAGEIAKSGLGYLLLMASLYVLWIKDRELNACREIARLDAVKMAVALEQAARAISETTDVERQRVETDKVNSSVLQALIKASDVADERARDRDDRAKERTEAVLKAIEQLGRANVRS